MTFASANALSERARITARVLGVALIVLALLLVAERFGAAPVWQADSGAQLLRQLLVQGIRATPEACYLFALFGVREALRAFSHESLRSPVVAPMLKRVGLRLAAGGFIGVLVVPGALRLVGADPGYWIAFDISGWTLGLLGLALRVFAGVLRQASADRAELDQIF